MMISSFALRVARPGDVAPVPSLPSGMDAKRSKHSDTETYQIRAYRGLCRVRGPCPCRDPACPGLCRARGPYRDPRHALAPGLSRDPSSRLHRP